MGAFFKCEKICKLKLAYNSTLKLEKSYLKWGPCMNSQLFSRVPALKMVPFVAHVGKYCCIPQMVQEPKGETRADW